MAGICYLTGADEVVWLVPTIVAAYGGWSIASGGTYGIRLSTQDIVSWNRSKQESSLYSDLEYVIVRVGVEGWDLKFVRMDGTSFWFETENSANRACIIQILGEHGVEVRNR